MLPCIVGAIETAFLGLDNCVHAIGIGSRNGDADLAQDSVGKTVSLEPFPCDAIIFRSVQAAAGTATGEKPRLPPRLPEGCEYDVRIMRIKHDVDSASVLVFRQNFGPSFSAIRGTKNSAFLVWTKRVTQ